MLRKIMNAIKFWIGYYPPELKEMHKNALETNRIYQQALDKVETSPKTAVKRKPAVKKATTRSKTMPLKKSTSKTAFKSNVAKEIKEGGKPVKQAVAIAYAVKREAAKKTAKAK